MSIMTRAVIGMPYKLAMNGEMSRRQFYSHAQVLLTNHDRLKADNSTLSDALIKIIEMNRQHAKDQFGDADKAESWACVSIARQALKMENQRIKPVEPMLTNPHPLESRDNCLACGGKHPGMSGLQCPLMAPMSISPEKSQAIAKRGRDAIVDAMVIPQFSTAITDEKPEDFKGIMADEPDINFDMERMEKALAGKRHILPTGLTGDEIGKHLIATAKKLRGEE